MNWHLRNGMWSCFLMGGLEFFIPGDYRESHTSTNPSKTMFRVRCAMAATDSAFIGLHERRAVQGVSWPVLQLSTTLLN